MNRRITPILLLIMSLSAAEAADAQETGQKGLTLGYPASIGLLWHVSDRFAIRPEFAFAFSSNEVTTTSSPLLADFPIRTVTTDSNTTTVGIGVSALFYLWKAENLSTYLAPRLAYTKTKTTSEESGGQIDFVDVESSNYAFSGMYGVQYSLIPRLSIFGEVGIGLTDTNGSSSLSRLNGRQIATRGGAGMVFYF